MNGKRIAALAVLSALMTSAGPAFAANPTATVTIKWNTQQLATLNVTTNYSATGVQQLTAPAIYQNINGGSAGAGCTATGFGSEAAQTVNFGNVTPDSVKYVDCLYDNGINAYVATNDTNGYSLTVYQSTPTTLSPTSFQVCLLANGAWSNTGAVVQSTRNTNALVPSIVTTANAAASCGGAGTYTLTDTAYTAAAPLTLFTNAGSTAGANFGGDVELVLAPNAPSGANSTVVTYTLALN